MNQYLQRARVSLFCSSLVDDCWLTAADHLPADYRHADDSIITSLNISLRSPQFANNPRDLCSVWLIRHASLSTDDTDGLETDQNIQFIENMLIQWSVYSSNYKISSCDALFPSCSSVEMEAELLTCELIFLFQFQNHRLQNTARVYERTLRLMAVCARLDLFVPFVNTSSHFCATISIIWRKGIPSIIYIPSRLWRVNAASVEEWAGLREWHWNLIGRFWRPSFWKTLALESRASQSSRSNEINKAFTGSMRRVRSMLPSYKHV